MDHSTLAGLIIPAAAFTVMVGLGLSLTVDDFRRVLQDRKAMVVGLFGQLVLLPLVGYLVLLASGLPSEYGLGLLILALCPGGSLSNVVTHLARAELALSVSLTAVASLITPVTLPLLYAWFAPGLTQGPATIELPVLSTAIRLFVIAVVPVRIGMAVRKCLPSLASRADKPVSVLSMVLFVFVITAVIKSNWEDLPLGVRVVGPAALALNIASLTLGFVGARLARLNSKQAVTISIEVGMQNAAMATFVTATLLGSVTMAIVPAIYAMLMVPSALILGMTLGRAMSASPDTTTPPIP